MWNKLELHCDGRDRDLFVTSTVVMIGDGKLALYWTSSWIQGKTPQSLAPTLLKNPKRKHIIVQKAMNDNRWITNISPLQTPHEMREYATLWEAVCETQLGICTTTKDSIRWRWTVDRKYTTKSAYLIQFKVTFSKMKIVPIWKARVEPKCHFFAWTILHKKILTRTEANATGK